MEKKQVASIFFLFVMTMPVLLAAAGFIGPGVDLVFGFMFALIGSTAFCYLVRNRNMQLVCLVALTILAPTLFSFFTNPVRLTTRNLSALRLKTTSTELIGSQLLLAPIAPFLSKLSLIPLNALSLEALPRGSIHISKKFVTNGNVNAKLFQGVDFGDQTYQLLILKTKRKVRGKVNLVEMPVLVPKFNAKSDEDYDEHSTYQRQLYPAWHVDYEPTDDELKPKFAGANVPDPDKLWFNGKLIPFDVDAAKQRSLFKSRSNVRAMALWCDNGGGIGDAPEGSTVLGAFGLFLPVAFVVAMMLLKNLPTSVETKTKKKKKN